MLPEFSYFKILQWNNLALMREFLRKPHSGFFSIVDADKIVSLEQARICYFKSLDIVKNSSRIKLPESAFLMLLSGQNQIARAQEEIGISSSTKSVLMVYESRKDIEELLNQCGSLLEETVKIPIPELARERDGEIFARMARVQLSL